METVAWVGWDEVSSTYVASEQMRSIVLAIDMVVDEPQAIRV